jgi:truncated hemoglobin YjbI
MKTLYERVGGEPACIAAVALFHRRVLADPLTRTCFDGVDMNAQARRQLRFICWALGAPGRYKASELAQSVEHLTAEGLTDAHFDALTDHLEESFDELGLENELVVEVMLAIIEMRAKVLGR